MVNVSNGQYNGQMFLMVTISDHLNQIFENNCTGRDDPVSHGLPDHLNYHILISLLGCNEEHCVPHVRKV